MTEKEIFDRIVTIIQERQGRDFVVIESLSLKKMTWMLTPLT